MLRWYSSWSSVRNPPYRCIISALTYSWVTDVWALICTFLLTCSWTLLATLVIPRASALSLRLLHLLTTRSALQCLRYMQQLVYLTTVIECTGMCAVLCHVHIRPPSGTAIHWWHELQYRRKPGRWLSTVTCLALCIVLPQSGSEVLCYERSVCAHILMQKREAHILVQKRETRIHKTWHSVHTFTK